IEDCGRRASWKWYMSATVVVRLRSCSAPDLASAFIAASLRLVHTLIDVPVLFFFAALTAMLFRPPDLTSWPWDRVAFVALICVFGLTLCLRRAQFWVY